jgi:hypothetical protein
MNSRTNSFSVCKTICLNASFSPFDCFAGGEDKLTKGHNSVKVGGANIDTVNASV